MIVTKRSRTRQPDPNNPHEAFQAYADDMNRRAAENQPEPEPDFKAQNAKLQEALDKLQARVDASEQAALSRPDPVEHQTVVARQELPQLDFDKIPDPNLDPIGYTKAINEHINRTIQAQRELDRNEQETRSKAAESNKELWSDFAMLHPDIAKDEEKVRFATESVVREAARKGVNVQRYMHSYRDRFFQDIVKKYESTFVSRTNEQDEPDDDEDEGRTSVFGGSESGGRPAGKKRNATVEGDMLAELRDIQKKSGLW